MLSEMRLRRALEKAGHALRPTRDGFVVVDESVYVPRERWRMWARWYDKNRNLEFIEWCISNRAKLMKEAN